jgi:hypothetical protein
MTTQIEIEVEDRKTPFELDWERQRWRSLEEQKESDFPLITVVDGKRYELYSDETFAEVEKSERAIIPPSKPCAQRRYDTISQELICTARTLFANDKGLLAMDESNHTCNKRFA